MRVRERHTGEEFEVVLVEDLADYADLDLNTDERAQEGERWVPVTSPSGDAVLVSLAPGGALIVAEDGTRTAVTNSHSDQYEWLES